MGIHRSRRPSWQLAIAQGLLADTDEYKIIIMQKKKKPKKSRLHVVKKYKIGGSRKKSIHARGSG